MLYLHDLLYSWKFRLLIPFTSRTGNHLFVFYTSASVFIWICFAFTISHVSEIIRYLSFSDLKFTQHNTSRPMLSRMARFFKTFILEYSRLTMECLLRCTTYSKMIQLYPERYAFFTNSFSSQVIPEYCVEFPVLYSRSLLVICFKYINRSIYLSNPNSRSVLPYPFPLVTISLFSKSLSVSVL